MEWTFDSWPPSHRISAFFFWIFFVLVLAVLWFPFSCIHLLQSSRYFFLTMSSFLSDFAIGIGGSDSGGSIQQPWWTRRSFPLAAPPQRTPAIVLLTMNSFPWSGWGFHVVLVEVLLASARRRSLPLLPRSGNLSRSLWFTLLLFLGDQGEVWGC